MHAPRWNRRAVRIAIALTMLGSVALTAPVASAHPGHRSPLDLVVLGDSFAAGVGTPPYIDPPSECKRSDAAYAKILDAYRSINLQAFVACSGATTTHVGLTGSKGEPPQVDSITADTDVVTVQALGNDFAVSTIQAMCFSDAPDVNCEAATPFPVPPGDPLYGLTVGDVVASIPTVGGARLDALYAEINRRLTNPKSKALAIGYPGLLGDGGPYCAALITPGELAVAAQMVTNLNTVIKSKAQQWGLKFVPVERLFRGLDACGPRTAIYPPLPPGTSPKASEDPQGALHPNPTGHAIYAKAIAKRIRR